MGLPEESQGRGSAELSGGRGQSAGMASTDLCPLFWYYYSATIAANGMGTVIEGSGGRRKQAVPSYYRCYCYISFKRNSIKAEFYNSQQQSKGN